MREEYKDKDGHEWEVYRDETQWNHVKGKLIKDIFEGINGPFNCIFIILEDGTEISVGVGSDEAILEVG